MMIRVIYADNRSGTVKDHQLDGLITKGKIVAFRRASGWATIGRDPLRGSGGEYSGPERRGQGQPAEKPADFFG
jgi:hypothetical protein